MSQRRSYPRKKTSEPGVFKRGNRYQVYYRDPDGRQRSKSLPTLAAARDFKASVRADIRRGEYRADELAPGVTFAEHAASWIASYQGRTSRGIRDVTRDDYRRALGLDRDGKATGGGAIAFLGNRRLAGISPADLKRYVRHLQARRVSRNTVRLALAPLKAMLADAFEDGLIPRNPAAGLRIGRGSPPNGGAEPGDDRRALSPEELGRLLGAIPEQHRLLVRFLSLTGLRIAEACGLQWRDVAADAIEVRRRWYRGTLDEPKTSERRSVPLAAGLGRDLWAHRKAARWNRDTDFVFASANGGPLHASNYRRRVLVPACEATGLEWATGYHVFRRTCASFLFRPKADSGAGMSVRQVASWLGHADPSMTLRAYVALIPNELQAPAELDTMLAIPLATTRNVAEEDTEKAAIAASS